MRRVVLAVSVAIFAVYPHLWAKNLEIRPTTTLSVLTSNNTSVPDSFAGHPNGNAAAGNISKIDLHSLLYSGSRTRIYAHLMMWWGSPKHVNIGYDSTDPAQIQRQIGDMISRGVDGVLIDWYGAGTPSDQATLGVMKEAEKHPGFTFAVIVDNGAIKWYSCPGCSPQEALADHLQYLERTYFSSPAYLHVGEKPVVSNFDIDNAYTVDWQAANKTLTAPPAFIFQHSSGFTHVLSDGSYAWIQPTTNDYGMGYLKDFYATGKSHPDLQTFGTVYKGFNDTIASWTLNRIMSQQCGQTWLQTFAKINSLYSASHQLDALQLATWNDYEEGTEIESGIDNCVSITAKMSGSSIRWDIKGNENTIDHYKVFISKDGQNLMPLTDMATGLRSLNLCSFSLAQGQYKLFVQAIGRPSMANHMAGMVTYTPACSSQTASDVKLQANPQALNIAMGGDGKVAVSAQAPSGLKDQVTLSCTDLPVGMSCSFSPAIIAADAKNPTSTLTLSAQPVSVVDQRNPNRLFYAGLFAFGMVGLVGVGKIDRKDAIRAAIAMVMICSAVALSSCGGGSMSNVQSGASYSVTVVGTSGGAQIFTTVSVSVK